MGMGFVFRLGLGIDLRYLGDESGKSRYLRYPKNLKRSTGL